MTEAHHRAGTRERARDALLSEFEWNAGHANVWGVFESATTFAAVVAGLADSWADSGVTKVVGVESRGFLLGGAVAIHLGVGFQAVRKAGALFPGQKRTITAAPDYRGVAHVLAIQDTLTDTDVVLMVDDWAQRGAQALAVRSLVEGSGASFAGLSLMVDQLDDATRARLGRLTALVTADELGDPED